MYNNYYIFFRGRLVGSINYRQNIPTFITSFFFKDDPKNSFQFCSKDVKRAVDSCSTSLLDALLHRPVCHAGNITSADKMATRLEECTRQEHRSVIRFLSVWRFGAERCGFLKSLETNAAYITSSQRQSKAARSGCILPRWNQKSSVQLCRGKGGRGGVDAYSLLWL